MTQSPVSTLDRTSVERQNKPDARLHRGRLRMGRIAWVAIAALSFSLFLLGLPPYAAQLHMICTSATACVLDGVLSPTGLQLLRHLGISLDAYVWYTIVFTVLVALVWAIVGLVIFWRRSDDWMALIVALFLVTINPVLPHGPTDSLVYFSLRWTLPVEFLNFSGAVLIGLFLLLFPGGRFVPHWMRWILVLYLVEQSAEIFVPLNSVLNPLNWPVWLYDLLILILFGAAVCSQIYRYRRISTLAERQQTKWALFGIVIALVGLLALNLVPVAFNLQSGLFNVANDSLYFIVLLAIPFSIGVAVLRSRLFDIDILINRTLVYGTLTVSLALVYTGLVIGSQALLRELINQTNDIAIVASTLAVAALFQPLRHRIQAIIDRRFYRRKYDTARTLAAFSVTLRNEVDLATLSEHLVAVVQETMQPTLVSLWLRPPAPSGTHQAPWSATFAGSSGKEPRAVP